MDQHAKLSKPILIEKLRSLVAEKKKAQALKAMPVKRDLLWSEQGGRNDSCTCGGGKKYKKCCLLKEKDGDYLVCFGFVFIASYNSKNKKWYPKYGQAGLENRITHWMDLPVPPRD